MIYEVVRKADVPKSARLAATRGAILVRGGALLGEQLKSDDDAMFAVAIGASRLLPDRDVTQLLLGTLGTVPPARQVLVIGALEGRRDPTVLPAVQKAAAGGPVDVRLAAIRALGELADPSSVPVLLAAFSAPEPALAETAQASLAKLAGPGVDAAIAAELERANPKTRDRLAWTSSRGGGSSPPWPPRSRRPTIRSPKSAWPRSAPWGESSGSKSSRPWWPVCWPPRIRMRSSSFRKPSRPPARESPIGMRVQSGWPVCSAAQTS